MNIRFENIVPKPLEGVISPKTEIWQKDVSFLPQQHCQVYSPSGKGKSSFLHIIYGLRDDFTGNLWLNDKNARSFQPDDWAKLRQDTFSIVFQDLRLFLHLTAWENLLAKAALYPQNKEKELHEQAEFLGVSHVLHKPTHTLSYGERQRVAIIRALIQPFRWLLLDEPFSHLDQENIAKASKLINQKVSENQATILMTSLGYEYELKFEHKKCLG